uniref:Uncharacterized protein n=1 Tax=Mycena chlorophos TaxID=658473 RepID=A0ABQ0MBE5_MYCCL|nr:predicted protein [Mycena chlorophos]
MYTHTQFKVRVEKAKSPTPSPDPFDDQHDSIETFSSPIKGKGKGKERQRDEDYEEEEALSRHVMERGMEMADAAASARRAEKAQYATRPNGVTLDQIAQLRQQEAQAQEDQSLTESDPHASQPTPGAAAIPKDILALREEEEESTQDIMLEFLNEEELAAGDKELESQNVGGDPHDEEIPASSDGDRSYDMPEKIAFYAEQTEVLSQQQSQSQEIQEEDEDDSMGQLGYPGESPARKNTIPPVTNDAPPPPPPRLSPSRSNSRPAPESQPIIDLPPTASTSENSPAKGKAPVEDPEVRLEQAMQLLHQKSDEIRQLQKQLQDEQLTVITERARNTVLRDMINAESSAMVVDGGIGLDERLVAALAAKRQALADLAEAKTLQATLMTERDSARSSSADHAQRAQVFHEEYQRASAFGQEKAKEARELQSQLEIMKQSLQNGVELVKETFAKREAVLTAEVVEWRNQARFLREQAVRTNDDDLRRRAAEHPELVAKVKTLNANIDDLRDQVDQLFLDLGAARDERDRANEEHEKLQREQTTVLAGDMLVYRCLWRSDETGPCTIFCPTKEALSEHAQMHAQLAGLANSSQ